MNTCDTSTQVTGVPFKLPEERRNVARGPYMGKFPKMAECAWARRKGIAVVWLR